MNVSVAQASTDESTILIVDDQALTRANLARQVQLMSGKVNVVCKANGLEAWAYLQANGSAVDLLLTDLNMPELDGIGLIEQLRKNPETAHIPAIMITVMEDRKTRQHALERGATDFLSRPVDPDECRARCRNLLNLSKAHRLLKSHLVRGSQINGAAGAALAQGVGEAGDDGQVTLSRTALQELNSAVTAATQLLEHSRAAMARLEGQMGEPLSLPRTIKP